jgi:hypothetical protein
MAMMYERINGRTALEMAEEQDLVQTAQALREAMAGVGGAEGTDSG